MARLLTFLGNFYLTTAPRGPQAAGSARKIVNVQVRDVEADEVWSFIGKKEKRVRPEDDQNFGDAYTFVAIERNTKLVLNFALGKRNQATTDIFIEGLRHATAR